MVEQSARCIRTRSRGVGAIAIALALIATALAVGQTAAAAQPLTCAGKTVTIDMNTPEGSGYGPGTNGDDVILGTPGDDSISAGAGNDTICGGGGRDLIYGGEGDDHILGGDGIDYLFGMEGADTIEGNGGSDRIRGGDGNDYLRGGSGADRMWGDDGDDEMLGQGGQDQMWGGYGDDTMQGNWQSDLIYGGRGNDTIGAAEGKDTVYGGSGNDTINGGNNTDALHGGPGADTVSGGAGTDTLSGGADIDFLNGGPHTDTCHRGSGDSMLSCQTRTWEISDGWLLAEASIDGETTDFQLLSPRPARIEVDESTSGYGGTACNSGGGTVMIDGNTISIDVGITTLAVCGGALAVIDNLIFNTIEEMTTFTVSADLLSLSNPSGTRSITFIREAPEKEPVSLLGNWGLVTGTHNACHGTPGCLAPDLAIEPVTPGAITLTIDETRISGSSGCNSYSGDRDLSVPFGTTQLATTLIGCEKSVAHVEQLYLEALSHVTNVELTATTLKLTGPGAVLEFGLLVTR